ncbi:MAG: YggS family pyridoxal phosphate-dependent enzyme [Pseudomonadota bacterium]
MLSENINAIKKRIEEASRRSGREISSVKLLAATKSIPVPVLKEAISLGLGLFGENYIQEARKKIEEMGRAVSWHFIGRLQTNKAKYAVRLFDLIHSLDGEDLALELNRRAAAIPRILPVLIEVNLGAETAKGGIAPREICAFLGRLSGLSSISVRGLMTMPPCFDDPERARPHFRKLREIRDDIRAEFPGMNLSELSMGMTGDFEAAIEEGATIIRVGTALFGPRSQ